jgi:hypothetical protein
MTGLTCVTNGCSVVTYGPRQRCPEGRTSESCSHAAAGIRADARRRRAVGTRVFDFSAASVSIPAAGLAVKATGTGERIQAGVHRQAPTSFDPAGAVVRICQANLNQRSRDSSATGVPATRGRSWLSRSRSRHDVFSWNIDLIACHRTNWRRHMICWCPTVDGRSEPHPSNRSNLFRS